MPQDTFDERIAASYETKWPHLFAPEVVGPPGEPTVARPKLHVYVVAVMSNELKRNAASDHARLASEIHALVVGQ